MKFTRILKRLFLYTITLVIAGTILIAFGKIVTIRQQGKDKALHNLRYFLYKTLNSDFFGIWSNIESQKRSYLFHQQLGNAALRISGDPELFARSLFSQGVFSLSLKLQEKFKVASSSLTLQLASPIYNKQEETLYFPEQLVFLKYVKSASRIQSKECLTEAKAAIKVLAGSDTRFYLEVNSLTCPELNMRVTADPISHDIKTIEVLFHAFFCYILLGVQVYFVAQLDISVSNNLQQASNVSIMSLLMLSTFQLFNGFEQLVFSVFSFPLWGFIVLIGIAFFNLFFFTILKLMTTVLKNQLAMHIAQNPGFPVRRHLLFEYLVSHATILSSFYVCLEYSDKPALYLGWSAALLPQIIKNFLCRTRFLAPMKNIAGFYVSLIIFALYQHFFKYNFFYVRTNADFNEVYAGKIILAVVLMLLVLVWQETCSPHLVLCKLRGLCQATHGYLKSLSEVVQEKKIDPAETDCIICLVSLGQEIKGGEWEEGLDNDQLREFMQENKEKGIMVTPCEHYYHTSCLIAWMSVKMDCPCCRQTLPPII